MRFPLFFALCFLEPPFQVHEQCHDRLIDISEQSLEFAEEFLMLGIAQTNPAI